MPIKYLVYCKLGNNLSIMSEVPNSFLSFDMIIILFVEFLITFLKDITLYWDGLEHYI